MSCDLDILKVKDFVDVTDYVANGSFAALKDNVTYCDKPDYAVLVRLADHNSGWQNDLVYVDENSYKFLKKSSVQPGDVIISNVGANAGTVFRAPDLGLPMTLGPNSVLLKPKEDTPEARDFLYYFFSSPKGQHSLKSILSGSAQPKFNKTDLRNTEIVVPKGIPLAKVTGVLKSLDEKITLNLLNNQTLEEIAHSIFKSWFVDFDPVKAKMNGEQPEGMDAATASLFPEKLVESELGLIPEGWDINYIKDFGKVVTGKTPPKKVEDAYAEEGVPFVTPSDIDSDVFVSETKRFLSESGVEAVKKSLLPEGSICVTCIGSQMGKAVISPSEAISNQQINSIVVSKDYVRNFLFLNLRRRREEIFLIGSSGSTMPIINKSTFEKLAVLTPSEELMRSFDRSVSSLLSKIHQNAIENQTLSSLRDTLLPKLLSGEIELGQAQELAEVE
ncbi:hypothetical protein CGJ26_00820 [Vibrio parahaemolyticus]|uniref:restriction endonuclease subunit S n=1 Tax=Vibrio parahaemolyticus TaxID=670 RepID=UPI0011213EF8|nr:restriction endonuclease subunit S [Vibrio parahaemolyticus]TOF24569.1 hypothetical protein CGJ26_00820 [Vibrio parahaemolyticus]